ncbi:MAG: dihydroorotase [Candidatus Spyradocola sp.]
MKLLVKGGTLPEVGRADMLVEDGVIRRIEPNIECDDARIVDAEGLYVMPGMVDLHCHLRDPGQEYKEDIVSGTRAAAAGGFTSVCCMANTTPVNDNAVVTSFIINKAKTQGSGVHVYPVGAVSKGLKGENMAEIGDMAKAGAVAISDDGKPVMNALLMRLAMEYGSAFGMTVFDHCEDINLVNKGVMNEGYNSTLLGLRGTTRAAEEVQIARDVVLSETLGLPIHICHVSTKGGVQLIRDAKKRGVKITAETAPHYLAGTDDLCASYNANTKVNPPMRLTSDQEALIEGLCDGTIDAIATDHAPHHRDEKEVEYNMALSGISGFETAFALCVETLVHGHHMTMEDFVRVACTNPARIIKKNCGELKPGMDADFILTDPNEEWCIDSKKFLSKGKNTPFDGRTVHGRVKETYVGGVRIYKD